MIKRVYKIKALLTSLFVHSTCASGSFAGKLASCGTMSGGTLLFMSKCPYLSCIIFKESFNLDLILLNKVK